MRSVRALTLSVLLLGPLATASAQEGAAVHVEVTDATARPADARVILRAQEGGAAYECVTRNGSCTISNVAPGQYVVSATPSGEGRAPVPRVVPVPRGVPSIEVRVRLL
ncbi:MAG: carboxypeptidase regulatory-like domain-containing protein [Sandaracinaceae bacterium]|nr:carboxypeptidase regulatory-like domain-containing protein [Sandaracinaceae bacterium]